MKYICTCECNSFSHSLGNRLPLPLDHLKNSNSELFKCLFDYFCVIKIDIATCKERMKIQQIAQ